MTAARIPCINPRCRRTAAAEKHPGHAEIICGKCFRALPQKLRSERRGLDRAWRRMHRRIERRRLQGAISPHIVDRICHAIDRRFRANWQRICDYFIQPKQPVGIEGFLQEVGLA